MSGNPYRAPKQPLPRSRDPMRAVLVGISVLAAVFVSGVLGWGAWDAHKRDADAIPRATAAASHPLAAPSVPSVTPAAVSATAEDVGPASCASVAASNRNVIERVGKTRPACKTFALDLEPMSACLHAGSADWTLAIGRVTVSPQEGAAECGVLSVRYSIVHLAGAVAAEHAPSPAFAMRDYAFMDLPTEGFDLVELGPTFLTPTLEVVFDWDGDGEKEVALTFKASEIEWSSQSSTLYTFRAGRVEPYAPARDLAILEIKDVDGDGRPDLRTHGPYAGRREYYSDVGAGPLSAELVAHSLPDGTFSLTDAVARAQQRKLCPDGHHGTTWADAIVCARMWGASPEEAVSRVASKLTPGDDGRSIAAIAPPTLR